MAKDFSQEWAAAVQAAQEAGDRWLAKRTSQILVKDAFTNKVVGSMLDICGYGYVTTKLSTAFGKYATQRLGRKSKWIDFGQFTTHAGNQAMGLNTAMANAARDSLVLDGVKGLGYHEWVD